MAGDPVAPSPATVPSTVLSPAPVPERVEVEKEGEESVGWTVNFRLALGVILIAYLSGAGAVVGTMGDGLQDAHETVIHNSEKALELAVNRLRISASQQITLCLSEVPKSMKAALTGMTVLTPAAPVAFVGSLLKSTLTALQSTSNQRISAYYVEESTVLGLAASPDTWGVNKSWLLINSTMGVVNSFVSADGERWEVTNEAGEEISQQVEYVQNFTEKTGSATSFGSVHYQPTLQDLVLPVATPCGVPNCHFYIDSTTAYLDSILDDITPTFSANSRSVLMEYSTQRVVATAGPIEGDGDDPYLTSCTAAVNWLTLSRNVALYDARVDCSVSGCEKIIENTEEHMGDGDDNNEILEKTTIYGVDLVLCQATLAIDEVGLKIVLVAAAPRSDYFAVLDKITEDSKRQQQRTLWVSVTFLLVLATISLAAFAVVAKYFMDALSTLREKMAIAATWDLEPTPTTLIPPPSRITEIACMQRSFHALCDRLYLIKDFIPRVGDTDNNEDEPQQLPNTTVIVQNPLNTQVLDIEHMTCYDDTTSIASSEVSTPVTLTDRPSTFVSETMSVITTVICLKRREVTLMEGNVRNFLGIVRSVDILELEMIHRNILSAFISSISMPKSFTDFKGDRVFGYFTMIGHRVESLKASCTVQNNLSANPITKGIHVTIGLATGHAMCGNLGCEGIKRYNYISGTAVWAHVVERLANKWDLQILADNAVCRDSATLFICRAVEQVVFPKRGSTQPIILWEIVSRHVQREDNQEWMYVIKQEQDPWTALNKVVKQHWNGDHIAALNSLSKVPATAPKRAQLLQAIEEALSKQIGPIPPIAVTEIGITTPIPETGGETYDEMLTTPSLRDIVAPSVVRASR